MSPPGHSSTSPRPIPPRPIPRRTFLRGACATIVAPYLEALAPGGSAPPVRAAWLYFPNGVAEGSWEPHADRKGRLLRLNETMAPLERHREHIVIPQKMFTPRGNGHGAGTATWLTGAGWEHRELNAQGPSIDQMIAREVADEHVAPALTISARGEGFFAADVPRNTMSWAAPGRPVFRETDPRAVFQQLFGGGPSADTSLLDDLKDQVRALQRRVSQSDRRQLDAYLDAIRTLERRIAFVQDEVTARRLARASELGLPFDPERPIEAVPADHGEYLDLLLDLVALALWSGASRCASFMLDHGQSNRYCTFVPGVRGTWHALSHWKDTSGKTEDDDGVNSWSSRRSKRQMYDAVVTWHHERVARFLDRLASLPEPGGSLLDQSMVLYGSSISDGHEHGERDLPTLIAGGAGGAMRGGRLLRHRHKTPLERLHLATLRATGVSADSFGDEDSPLDLA